MPETVPNRQLVVLALALIDGETKYVHTEDIAIKSHELFPDSFSWIKHPHIPDKDAVRVALTDARKEKHGALVVGRVGRRRDERDGWKLTEAGIAWVAQNRERFDALSNKSQRKEHRQKLLKQLRRIKDHELFRRYVDSPTRFAPEIGDIAALLRCRVDASPAVWAERFEKIRTQALAAEQQEVVGFIVRCEVAYQEQK
jgi:hypothetical protein